jgi:hypothetical protein
MIIIVIIIMWHVHPLLGNDFGFNNELIVGESPAGKNVSREAICHKATTGEDTAE